MSLQIVYGSSGIGKSYKMYKDVIALACKDDKESYQIIVPEQFTMETQKLIVKMHPGQGVMNIDASSFVRLAYRVFDENGIVLNKQLDDLGKDIIIRQLVEKNKDKLGVLAKNIDKMGYIEEIKSVISELLQYDISADKLKEVISNTTDYNLLNVKLNDILFIYNEFMTYIEDKYIASEELLDILCACIKDSEYVKTTTFILDGFTGFTPLQLKLIGELLKYSRDVIISFTIDANEKINVIKGVEELFYLPKDSISKLYNIAQFNEINIKEPIIMQGENQRFRESVELSHLEKNIFRYNFSSYKEIVNDIKIFECSKPKEEIERLIYEIKHLIVNENYRYKDIAVVTGNMDNYGEMTYKLFEQNNIPAFLDNKKNILSNPAIEGILALTDICLNDFDYASVFTYLKSGISDIAREHIDELENYVLAYGIRGKSRWSKEWLRKNKQLSTKEDYIKSINLYREAFLNEVMSFCDEIKKCVTAKDYCVQIYNYMLHANIQLKLDNMKSQFEANGKKALAKEYSQIFAKIIEVLDKIVELMGEDEISFREFVKLLKVGFKEVKVGIIPPTIDVVTIGDIERTRLKDIKALFLIGVNDGIIPIKLSGGSILSNRERQILDDNNFKIKPLLRENVFIQRYYLYLNLTKPSRRLYLSYSRSDFDGKEIRKSYLIDSITKIFTELRIEYVKEDDNYKDCIVIPKAKLYTENISQDIGNEVAKQLYGAILLGTISRLEKYAGCSFRYFLEYGLKLNERQIYEIDSADIGNLFHEAMERVSIMIKNSEYDFSNLPDSVRKEYVNQAVLEVAKAKDDDIYSDSARNEFIIEKTIAIMDKTIWAIGKQFENSLFKAKLYEKEFETDTYELDNGAMMRLRGVIDRIDVYEDDENVYIRIVDYKTGSNELKPVKMYNGLQLQLLAYMNAALDFKWDKNARPAAVMYYNIKDPVVDKLYDNEDESKLEEAVLKELRMQGYVNSDERVKEYMDPNYDTFATKRGQANIVDEKLVRDMGKFIIERMVEYGNRIIKGDISINPYKEGQEDYVCKYCPYKSVCRFNTPGCKFRKLENIDIVDYLKGGETDGDKVDTGAN
ncbi:MAG: hypothetical protein E7252_06900 [Lachnospira sp.]|nr:hypothetical protein [Lachnospira sp.]